MENVDVFLNKSDGNGSGYGDGSGYGNGSGDGSGSGYGNGDGYGDGLKSINNQVVHLIDGVQTVLVHIKSNVAKGFIVRSDLTTINCFVVKQGNIFAHGETLRDAQKNLEGKLFNDLSVEERIGEFLKVFTSKNKKYPNTMFFEWHNKLTNSCDIGRKTFAKDHQIDVENGAMTVKEFIELTKNNFGGDAIKKLENALSGKG